MNWIADLHLHSHFSIATSKDCNPLQLNRWAGLKGLHLVATGDFSHPGWQRELQESLVPAEPGFYRLAAAPPPEIPDQTEPRFIVSGELSTIYKQAGRVRKVHHLILLPSLAAAERISDQLEAMGMNLRSDGRPILGINSYRLLQLVLDLEPEAIFIPAHIWTPHFSVFGSNSGFDEISDCYSDLTPQIFALETGLSSDPAMNWRCSKLDRFTLVSNSDAHNPRNLAREANLFSGEFSYPGLKQALQDKAAGTFHGTLEFFPEEGKYHYDGHRACMVCWDPEQTQAHQGICPVCGRPVTIGVASRVAVLADRAAGFQPAASRPFQSLVPLRQLLASAVQSGAASQKVEALYFKLLKKCGPELTILRETELETLTALAGPLVAEGLRRLRKGEVEIKPGYDGDYGVVSVLRPQDRQSLQGQAALFASADHKVSQQRRRSPLLNTLPAQPSKVPEKSATSASAAKRSDGLSQEQLAIIQATAAKILVCAGPGTGKTRTLVERIAYLIQERQVPPAAITGVTFTNKAAAELQTRLGRSLNNPAALNQLNLGTFHGLAWRILNQDPNRTLPKLLDQGEARQVVAELLSQEQIALPLREALLRLSLLKNRATEPEPAELTEQDWQLYQAYQASLARYNRWDFDDLIRQAVLLGETAPPWLDALQGRFQHLLIDEFQDINALQYRLVKLWAKSSQSLMAIGDPNQSIYGFRGGSPQFFERLGQDFPELQTYQLTTNYRSPAVVIKAANALLESAARQELPPTSNSDAKQRLWWLEAPNQFQAAQAVADQIAELLGGATMLAAHGSASRSGKGGLGGGFGLADFAVLYRTGRQADLVESALAASGLPYRVVGSTPTLEADSVIEFLAFSRWLLNPADAFLLRNTMVSPRWGFNSSEVLSLLKLVQEYSTGSDYLVVLTNQPQVTAVGGERLNYLMATVRHFQSLRQQPLAALLQDWMERFNLSEDPELQHLQRLSEGNHNLAEFLNFLPLALEADLSRRGPHQAEATECITLATLHAAKGLEFPVVFIFGVEEGLIPYGKDPTPAALAEEQRLFYVGLTRAQQQLYLVTAQTRHTRNELISMESSRFLNLLPAEIVEKEIRQVKERARQLDLF